MELADNEHADVLAPEIKSGCGSDGPMPYKAWPEVCVGNPFYGGVGESQA
jgi:hypothetical protein